MPAFAITIFLGAFLLFQIQPLLGRYILPWFGGGPSVWTSCMLFFQALLLAGYAYSHALSSRLTPRRQGLVHLTLLALSLLALPLDPDSETWREVGARDPTDNILGLLLVTAGLPYVILSSTSPLLQRWFHLASRGREAYRLYALSNAGSLLALVSYPVVVEPLLGVETQALLWSGTYVVFVAACSWSAWIALRRPPEPEAVEDEKAPAPPAPPSPRRIALWLGLSACGSALLLATTNQMSQEVAVVPFLWVLPLMLYLLTFILTFESERWYRRRAFAFALAAAAPAAAVVLASGGLLPLGPQILIFSAALFAGCMVCHGELALSRPHDAHATQFYLNVALGGALGGLLVALAAPRAFPGFWEYPITLAACCLIALVQWIRTHSWRPALGRPGALWAPPPALALAVFTVGYAFWLSLDQQAIAVSRNFYGVLEVTTDADEHGPYRVLTHGRTRHGAQYLEPPRRDWPITYFGYWTGVGRAIETARARRPEEPLDIGVIGLGAGTLAAYGRAGDRFRFYEINPQVLDYAREYFTYLGDSDAEIETVIGDARLEMETEIADDRTQNFDVLVIDAFTSGAIPVHLLTAEAGEIYARQIRENGVLAFHITNRFLDLAPVVQGIAERLGMRSRLFATTGDPALSVSACTWMLLTRDERFFTDLRGPHDGSGGDGVQPQRSLTWTDNFAGLWQALR